LFIITRVAAPIFGYARSGVLVRVVDDQDRDLRAGEIGEVITKSDCVMDGYWQNPAASAETLRGGWLHTGDLGSMNADGLRPGRIPRRL
jgi:long-chain acyl-CoA synthetase